jgi:hypothetical protein
VMFRLFSEDDITSVQKCSICFTWLGHLYHVAMNLDDAF